MAPIGVLTANISVVVRFLLVALCLLPGAAPLSGVTMQQLSMDDLAVKSTAIVRGRISDSYTAMLGQTVYTHYHVTVSEVWKGSPASVVDVALPGGSASGVRQTYPGVPVLTVGTEYVFYLWNAPSSALVMPTGFAQGIFFVSGNNPGNLQISRAATADLMLDASGHPVQDQPVSMRLTDMKTRVAVTLSKSGTSK